MPLRLDERACPSAEISGGSYGKAFAAEPKKTPPSSVACQVKSNNTVDCEGVGRVTINLDKPPHTLPPTKLPDQRPALKSDDWSIFKPVPCSSYTLAALKAGCERGLTAPAFSVSVTPRLTGNPPRPFIAPDEANKFAHLLPALKEDELLRRFIPAAQAATVPRPVETPAPPPSAGAPEIAAITYRSGAIYHGQVAAGKPNGQGELRQPDGAVIAARFVNGVASGPGRYTTQAGLTVEAAHFQNNHLIGLYVCNGTDTTNMRPSPIVRCCNGWRGAGGS